MSQSRRRKQSLLATPHEERIPYDCRCCGNRTVSDRKATWTRDHEELMFGTGPVSVCERCADAIDSLPDPYNQTVLEYWRINAPDKYERRSCKVQRRDTIEPGSALDYELHLPTPSINDLPEPWLEHKEPLQAGNHVKF